MISRLFLYQDNLIFIINHNLKKKLKLMTTENKNQIESKNI